MFRKVGERGQTTTIDIVKIQLKKITIRKSRSNLAFVYCYNLRSDQNEKNGERTVGQNQVIMKHLITHFSTSSGVIERLSEQMSVADRESKASKAERCERTSEQTTQY